MNSTLRSFQCEYLLALRGLACGRGTGARLRGQGLGTEVLRRQSLVGRFCSMFSGCEALIAVLSIEFLSVAGAGDAASYFGTA